MLIDLPRQTTRCRHVADTLPTRCRHCLSSRGSYLYFKDAAHGEREDFILVSSTRRFEEDPAIVDARDPDSTSAEEPLPLKFEKLPARQARALLDLLERHLLERHSGGGATRDVHELDEDEEDNGGAQAEGATTRATIAATTLTLFSVGTTEGPKL
jgi:hypothetical protein